MHLRSLTMKGFKSFADPTTVELEPGITVVVGPNGSGKSNVVDAVAWVLGAQGPRVVRSAKMDDVIFAGTQQRPALGRAEVTLVIDNSDRRLPIEFAEVTIRRTLFRTGESEYELNGVACRLLDIQELLSDSGVGRSQHVIISQGQLDAILSAHPEERRAVIEEAAGVLKFRRRRERAARRLEGSEQGLVRVEDMLREVRRQLRPLERQAASAHRHTELSAQLDTLRRYLAASELHTLERTRTELATRSFELAGALATTERRLDAASLAVASAEASVTEAPPDELGAPLGRLNQLLERSRGLHALLDERVRSRVELLAALDDAAGLSELSAGLARVAEELERATGEARELEIANAELDGDEARLAADRPGFDVATPGADGDDITVQASEARSLLEQRRLQLESRRERIAEISTRIAALEACAESLASAHTLEHDRVEALRADLALRNEELGARAEASRQAEAARQAAERALAAASEARHGLASRVDALHDALEGVRREAGVELLFGMQGVLGTLVELVEVDDGVELAFEAGVEHALSAVVVSSPADARAALSHLLSIGRAASLLVAPTASMPIRSASSAAEPLRACVRGVDEDVDRLLDQLLDGVLLVRGGLDVALELLDREPGATLVTTDGDRLAPGGWRIGSSRSGATKAALEDAEAALAGATARHDEARGQFDDAVAVHERLRSGAAQLAADVEPLPGRLAASAQAAAEHAAALEVVTGELVTARAELEHEAAEADEVESRFRSVEEQLVGLTEAESAELARRAEAAAQRSAFEQRVRDLAARRSAIEVAMASGIERRSQLRARERELQAALAAAQAQLEMADVRRRAFVGERSALDALGTLLAGLHARLEDCTGSLRAEESVRVAMRSERVERLGTLRRERAGIEQQLAELSERRQRCEIEQAESRVRAEAAVEALRRELDLTPEELLAAPLPEIAEGIDPAQRRGVVERELRDLGPVNLLAESELAELSERNGFLEGQLEDIKRARRELNQVIHAIDTEIVSVFTAAFADVAVHFERLIETLFPSGSGSISLTAPDDLLESGVEIEARPAGRNVRRLSLLSGGERSLVALAFLFAVFRSRPSPFYLMDEVEAALDDANLQRFLALLEDFRGEAQLVVVSHQKRTMEVADALYGVSMQPGGASRVLSERLRNNASAAANRSAMASPSTS